MNSLLIPAGFLGSGVLAVSLAYEQCSYPFLSIVIEILIKPRWRSNVGWLNDLRFGVYLYLFKYVLFSMSPRIKYYNQSPLLLSTLTFINKYRYLIRDL